MNKTFKYIAILFAALLINTACSEDWLELELKGSLPFSSEALNTDDKVFEVLCGSYDMLQVKYFEGTWSSYYLLANLASDDGVPVGGGFSDRPEYWDFHQFEVTADNPALAQLWKRNYFGIYRANIVINEIDLDTDLVKLYKAEAKFLRAYFYFELVRSFGNIAFYTENLAPSEYSQENADKAEVYAQIEKDLTEAIAVLPNKSQQSSDDYSRASKGAAQSLLGKVYLYQEKFDEAASVLGDVVNSGQYDLVAEYDSIFRLSEEYGIESVFEIPYAPLLHGDSWGNGRESEGNIETQLTGPRDIALPGITRSGWGFDMIDSSLIDAFDAAGDEIRKYGTGFGPELYMELFDLTPEEVENNYGFPDVPEWTGWYQKKRAPYLGYNDPSLSNDWTYGNNERIIRFADVLLMYAEALNRKSSPDDATALQAVNRVRARVELLPLSATGNNLFEAIKVERRLELAMEGHHRYWDLVRWGDASSVLGSRGFIQGTHEIWPIPEEEIGKTNLTQNPGY
jgi:hypothetical protein